MHRALLILVTLLPIAFSALAQRQLPSALEARTAYCISVLNGRGVDAETRASLPAPRAQQDALRELRASLDADVRRLRSYLVPRMKYLDGAALLAAADRGQADVNAFLKTERACEERCEKSAVCLRACAVKDVVAERVTACRPVSWLWSTVPDK